MCVAKQTISGQACAGMCGTFSSWQDTPQSRQNCLHFILGHGLDDVLEKPRSQSIALYALSMLDCELSVSVQWPVQKIADWSMFQFPVTALYAWRDHPEFETRNRICCNSGGMQMSAGPSPLWNS